MSRCVRRFPLRIAVTGTRGKSGVTRLVAAMLRESGRSVIAKATGSKAVLILPDGSEENLRRRGRPTILEGKSVLRRALAEDADTLVLEMMSIHPECLFVESVQLFRPHIQLVTNIRLDHRPELGASLEEIAKAMASAISPAAVLIAPDGPLAHPFMKAAVQRKGRMIAVRGKDHEDAVQAASRLLPWEFRENLRIALATADFLGIPMNVAIRGMGGTRSDFGSLKVWTARLGRSERTWFLVSGFAANDPASTNDIFGKLKEAGLLQERRVVGLLNLRGDRGDRTRQWREAAEKGSFPALDKLVVIGDQARMMASTLKKLLDMEVTSADCRSLEKFHFRLSMEDNRETVLVGMGNMGGMGRRFVKSWERMGEEYGF